MLIPKDPKVVISRSTNRLEIEVDHRNATGWVLVGFAVLLTGAMILASMTPMRDGSERSSGDLMGIAFMTLLMDVPLLFGGLAIAINKTRIIADHHRVVIRSGPMPMYPSKPKLLHSDGVQQFFCRNISRSSSSSSGYTGGLYMMDREDHAQLILGVFPSPFAASQICHELQDFYHLEDLEVYGQPEPLAPRTRNA